MRIWPTLAVRRGLGDGLDSGLMPWTKAYANLPERYIMRKALKLRYKPPVRDPAFKQVVETSPIPQVRLERPWSDAYWNQVLPHDDVTPNYVEPIKKEDWLWFKGDRVEIMHGPDQGKQGFINYVVQDKNWVCVEGLNCEHEITGRSRKFPGVVNLKEKPLLVTRDIRLVDPSDEAATEVEWRFSEEGERVRCSIRTGHILPMPSEALETVDYKTPQGYIENTDTDTPARVVEEIAFQPRLCTFEMDIMAAQGIKETRIPPKTYFY
eukprot:snap_masked-scaffold795_size96016-processed-gene-0.16 protein:Tk10614 transcript:snap_masked-scaffold795_size96016-processed-gene-0.16-mRNA-1 annotation:"probable 39s ribosomal protein mitochondrial precursor"